MGDGTKLDGTWSCMATSVDDISIYRYFLITKIKNDTRQEKREIGSRRDCCGTSARSPRLPSTKLETSRGTSARYGNVVSKYEIPYRHNTEGYKLKWIECVTVQLVPARQALLLPCVWQMCTTQVQNCKIRLITWRGKKETMNQERRRNRIIFSLNVLLKQNVKMKLKCCTVWKCF